MFLRAILMLSLFVITCKVHIAMYTLLYVVLTDFPLGNCPQTGQKEVVVTVDGRLNSLTLVYH